MYLLYKKFQVVNGLEVWINEVEIQLDRKVSARLIKVVSIMEDMIKVDNTPVCLLSSLRNVVFVLNTQCQAHHKKWCMERHNRI